jgi:hypothetical protein
MLYWIFILVCVQDPTREVIVRHEAAEALGAIATDEVGASCCQGLREMIM